MVRPTYDPSLTKHDFMFMQPHLVNTSYRASFAYTTWTSLVIGHHLCTIFPSWLSFDHKGAPLHIQVVQSQPFQNKINGAPRSWSTSQRLVTYQSGCDSELGYERTTSERSSTHLKRDKIFFEPRPMTVVDWQSHVGTTRKVKSVTILMGRKFRHLQNSAATCPRTGRSI